MLPESMQVDSAVKSSDGLALLRTFKSKVQPLVDDRNKNRAHAHEHKTHGTADELSLEEVRSVYTDARSLLNCLSFVALGSTWVENDLNSGSVDLAAEDIIDVIFLPQWFRREMEGRGLRREEIYDRLHADRRPGPFNAQEKLLTVANRDPEEAN
jgi:hypothetical protein